MYEATTDAQNSKPTKMLPKCSTLNTHSVSDSNRTKVIVYVFIDKKKTII